MKKFFMVAVMAVAALTANAETQPEKSFSIMPHGGVGVATISNSNLSGDGSSTGISGTVGVEMQYRFSKLFGLSFGLDYTYIQTFSDSYTGKTSYDGRTYSGTMDFYYTADMLNAPILMNFHAGRWAFKTGVQLGGYLDLKGHLDLNASSNGASGSLNYDDDVENLRKFQVAIPVGVSFEFSKPVTLDLRANIPVTHVNDETYGNGNNSNMFNVMLTVGYRFDLGAK